jgi:phage baseplate assembly protein W
MANSPAFLGTGWAFPPTFSEGGADVDMVSGQDDIRQSLEILLATYAAERPFQANFGCDLRQFLFEEVDRGLINSMTSVISDSILLYETRVALNSVEINQSEVEGGLLEIQVDYTIRGTNSRFNLVYPFYLNEATQTPAS